MIICCPFVLNRVSYYRLTYDVMGKALKRVAGENGLPQKRIKTHCLRIGGASALAAAHIPDSLIQNMGRLEISSFFGLYSSLYKQFFCGLECFEQCLSF